MFTPSVVPAPLVPLLAGVRALGDDATTFSSGGAEGRAAWLAGLRQLADATEAVFTHALAVFDALGDGEVMHGSRSTQAWLQGALHLAPGDASERVRLARTVDVLAQPLSAARAGVVTFDQVRAIERAVRPLAGAQQAEAVGLLSELAGRADAGAVRVAGRRLREVVDPDGSLAEHEHQFTRRFLTLSPLLDGMTAVDGLLDAEGAGLVAAALAPLMVPTGPADRRSAGQRRADALVDVAALALRSEQLPVLSGSVASLDVVVPLDVLVGGSGPGVLPGQPEGAVPLTAAAVHRVACDAVVSRVLLGPRSVPLDLGLGARLFSGHQRRALALRDGGCRFPGCTRPSRWTDAHHVRSWLEGGPTDLANGLLLCRWHHRLLHEGGWRIEVDEPGLQAHGRLWFAGPGGQRLLSEPRGP